MTASTVSTLTDYALDVKTVCEAALATTLQGTPEISQLVPSGPVFDCCPALYVEVPFLREAPTSPLSPPEASALRSKFGNVILATYVITVVRCAANPTTGRTMPTVTQIEAVAAQVLEDAFALWNGVRHAVEDGTLFDGCLGVHFDGIVPIPEQGGCVGRQMTIRASIPGIPS